MELYSQMFVISTVEAETMSNSMGKFGELHKFTNFLWECFCWVQQYPSCVARGAGGATAVQPFPIGLKSTQNSTFLVLLRPMFAPKVKTAPQRDWGAEVVKDLLLFGPEKWSFFFWSAPKVGQEK